jgi:hypothetical protein
LHPQHLRVYFDCYLSFRGASQSSMVQQSVAAILCSHGYGRIFLLGLGSTGWPRCFCG